jgi:hypothetical protein
MELGYSLSLLHIDAVSTENYLFTVYLTTLSVASNDRVINE